MNDIEKIISDVEQKGADWHSDYIPLPFLRTEGTEKSPPRVRKIGYNIKLIFDQHPEFKDKFRYDSFNGEFQTSFYNNEWQPLEDHILRTVITKIQELYPYFDTGTEKVIKDYALLASMENSISPPLQYIENIKWDGKPRLKEWLHRVYHVPQNAYYSEIGTRWLKYLVKRLKYPGSKFDHILVFKGGQGFGKSSALRELCNFDGKIYFDESDMSPDAGKDFAISLRGNIIYEFSEGSITGYINQKKVKSFITKQSDKYRPPYMKSNMDFPRQNVFAMSTNDDEFLSDKTGERRYWIVEIPDNGQYADIDWIKQNKDQLFAEAYTLIHEEWEPFTQEVQEYLDGLILGHKEIDPVEDFVVAWFNELPIDQKKNGVQITQIKEAIKSDDTMREFWTKYLDKEISKVLMNVLKLEKMIIKKDNKATRWYVPTKDTPLVEPSNEPF